MIKSFFHFLGEALLFIVLVLPALLLATLAIIIVIGGYNTLMFVLRVPARFHKKQKPKSEDNDIPTLSAD